METDRALPDDLRYRPPGGPRLAEFLDGLRVENYWLKGHHIVWQTGQQNAPNGLGRASHSHCSAFVTAAAQYLGIYVLRPPYHDEVLLASAQDHWFKGYRRFQGPAAEASGWRKVGQSGAPGSLMLAVDAANAGKLVVASYAQRPTHDPVSGEPVYHPGHVAIIRPTNAPAPPWATSVERNWGSDPPKPDDPGPNICTAGNINSASLPMRDGFKMHPDAWPSQIDIFVHDTALEHDLIVNSIL